MSEAKFFPGRFDGKCLTITGAAQGIGLAVASRVAAEGGEVVLVDRARSSTKSPRRCAQRAVRPTR